MVINAIDDDHLHFRMAQPTRGCESPEAGTNDDHHRFATNAHRVN
jgi:hypothetical protein